MSGTGLVIYETPTVMREPQAPGLLELRSAASGCNLKRVMQGTLPLIKMYPVKIQVP